MDKEAESDSFIANVNMKKDGSLSERESLLEAETFAALLHHTQKQAEETASRIYRGDISVKPYRYGLKVPCEYCDHKTFCKFSESFDGNRYRVIRRRNAADVYEQMKQEMDGTSDR
jgi:ATP-dependent helicase/nuclease subunit B